MIELSINGESKQIAPHTTVAQLIEQMNLVGKRLAVERNGEIVPRGAFAGVQLADGDRLEIVGAVGGG